MSFPKQAVGATVLMVASVGALVWLGKHNESATDESRQTSSLGKPEGPRPTAKPEEAEQEKEPRVKGHAVRDLVPKNAWIVADFQGDLTGQKPFADQPGVCASVPAPERVVMAILPPASGTQPDFLIAARTVEDAFWSCARERILNAGGTSLAQNEEYEVLKSPSGVVARGPLGSMVFLSSDGHLEVALSALSDLTPGAGSGGPHAALLDRVYSGGADPKNSVLDLTLSLPADWLGSVGQDKTVTPLRFVRSAFVSAKLDGSALGGVECDEAGCPDVLNFMRRAQRDAISELPTAAGSVVERSLSMEHVPGTGRITLTWKAGEMPLGSLLGGFLGPTWLGR